MPVLVWMSTTPAVWNPYCAGSAPVISDMLLAKRDFDRLAEHRQPLGQFDAVQPVLHVGVLAAQMDLAEAVLRHAGRLEQHLVERGVGALRNVLQCLRREIIGRGAETGLDLLACDVELFGDDIKVHRKAAITGLTGSRGRIGGLCRYGSKSHGRDGHQRDDGPARCHQNPPSKADRKPSASSMNGTL